MKQLRITNIAKNFSSKGRRTTALAGTSLTVSQGEFVALLGPSGCGKSTLLRLIAGLLSPDSGRVEFAGWNQPPKCRLVFQGNSLFPWMNVAENVAFGLQMDGADSAVQHKEVLSQLSMMGMADCTTYYPHQLSGGMRQRVAIARAFITAPDILLMDEPLRALDAQMRLVIQEELLAMWSRQKPIVLYVTHDIEEAFLLADRVLVMSGKPGRISEEILSPLPRPRDLTGRRNQELEELKWYAWDLLEQEIRDDLRLSTAP